MTLRYSEIAVEYDALVFYKERQKQQCLAFLCPFYLLSI